MQLTWLPSSFLAFSRYFLDGTQPSHVVRAETSPKCQMLVLPVRVIFFLCSQGRPTGRRTTSPRQPVWAWWWTRPALRLQRAKRLCRAKQRSSSSETGRLGMPARSLLTMWRSVLVAHTEGLLFNKEHCIVDEHLACSCHLNFILLLQNPLAVLCEWIVFVLLLFADWLPLFFVHNCVFIFRFKTCYFYTLCSDNCLKWVKAQGNSLCTTNFMPGAFCIFFWCQALTKSCRK